MFSQEEFEKYCNEMRLYLALHHELYSNICKDVYLEELSSKAFKSIGKGSDWKADCSHEVGRDQTVGEAKISNKSGMISIENDNVTIKISGSRTSKYPTIEEKIDFLNKKNYDYILGCGTATGEKNNEENLLFDFPRRYYLYVIDGAKINYSNLKWIENKDKKGNQKWQAIGKGIIADIQTKSTSNQLWLTLDKSFCDHFAELEVDL